MALKRFTHGPPILVDLANEILDAIQPYLLMPGAATPLVRMPGGTLLPVGQGGVGTPGSWPWRVYNKTVTTTGLVQINGGDGQLAQLNGFTSTIGSGPYSGDPTDTLVSGVYPTLPVTGNGWIYGYATPTTPGTASPIATLPIFYGGSLPSQDVANPATYYVMPIASISNYATDGSGNVSFTVNNVYGSGYGPSTMVYCNGVLSTY